MLNSWEDFCFQEINIGTIAMDKIDTLFCFHVKYFSGEKNSSFFKSFRKLFQVPIVRLDILLSP